MFARPRSDDFHFLLGGNPIVLSANLDNLIAAGSDFDRYSIHDHGRVSTLHLIPAHREDPAKARLALMQVRKYAVVLLIAFVVQGPAVGKFKDANLQPEMDRCPEREPPCPRLVHRDMAPNVSLVPLDTCLEE